MPGSWAGLMCGMVRPGYGEPGIQLGPKSGLDALPVNRRGRPKEGTSLSEVVLSSRTEVPQTRQLHHDMLGSSITLHLQRGVSAHMPPVMKLLQIGHRVMGGVGSTGPDKTSDEANVAACAGCAAAGEARGRPGWERAEGAEMGGSARVQVALNTGWDSVMSDMHRAAVAAPSCRRPGEVGALRCKDLAQPTLVGGGAEARTQICLLGAQGGVSTVRA